MNTEIGGDHDVAAQHFASICTNPVEVFVSHGAHDVHHTRHGEVVVRLLAGGTHDGTHSAVEGLTAPYAFDFVKAEELQITVIGGFQFLCLCTEEFMIVFRHLVIQFRICVRHFAIGLLQTI